MVQVKDEPVDDEYDQALSSTAAVKEEPPSEKVCLFYIFHLNLD